MELVHLLVSCAPSVTKRGFLVAVARCGATSQYLSTTGLPTTITGWNSESTCPDCSPPAAIA